MEQRLLNNYEGIALRPPRSIESGFRNNTEPSRDPSMHKFHPTPQPTPELTTFGGLKLGWVQGVLIPCLLNIWGVMLFLRISWIVAQAGIGLTTLVIFISGVVCVITTLSLSAICTNGELQGGGVYFLVSRSLGAELGASVGIIFAFANAVAASMNTIGFCDSLNELLKSYSVKIIDNGPHDTRIVGAIALLVMCIICAIGMDWETKTQNFLIVVIVTAILNFILGAAIGPKSDEAKAQGFVGISFDLVRENWPPDFRYSEGSYHNFFTIFSMYFPAVTGVQAGANICGDLKDPGTAIPKGTMLALAISIASYLAMAVLSGAGALRDASGAIVDFPDTISDCKPNCEYGLHNNYQVMHLMAFYGPIIYGGCWAATLSTALTNLLSVPRLIQALGLDRIYPGLIFFSKRYGKHGEPYRGYVLTYLVSLAFLLIADLNTIAPLITNFYLASYALINFCTFHAAFFKPISWRPRFRFFNTWLSLAGFLICLVIMMVISWVMALATTFIFITLYLLVLYRKPEKSWGSSTDAQRYQETISTIISITYRGINIKSFNPQLLVMAGKPESRPWLLDLAGLITKIGSFMVVADIEPAALSPAERYSRRCLSDEWLHQQKLRAFYVLLQEFDFEQGMSALLQATGLGRIAPNVILMGYKHNWDKCPHSELLNYYRMIGMAFKYDLAVSILRVPTNMRPTQMRDTSPAATRIEPTVELPVHSRALAIMHADSDLNVDSTSMITAEDVALREPNPNILQNQMETMNSYRSVTSARKFGSYKHWNFNSNSVLDAWWLYDDGGMNILLPYIIARRASKDKMAMRIFALPRSKQKLSDAESHMAGILKSYRIDYSQLIMITDITDKPSDSTWSFYNAIVKSLKTTKDDECLLSDAEAIRLHSKTCRYLRLRELMIENSFGADLIVMSLPLYRQGTSAAMYMSWLEVMSHDMPPILFVRGNSTVVIDG